MKPRPVTIPLDHIGVFGLPIEELVSIFRSLGFLVSEPTLLETGMDSGSGNDTGARQASAHIIFADSYIELTAVTGADSSHHLAALFGRDPGIRLLVLRSDDAQRRANDLGHSGIPVTAVAKASRKLTYGDSGSVSFRWFALEDQPLPGTLTAYVEHLSRNRVFDPGMTRHPNTIHTMTALHHAEGRVPSFLASVAGTPVIADAATIRHDPFLSGIEFCANDLAAFVRILENNGVEYERGQDDVTVAASNAAGVNLRVTELAA